MQIIGHRGASGYKPENTLSSFQHAIAIGVDMIELDVYVIKSGEVVVFHDNYVDRTTNGTGLIEDYTFEELRTLDAGNGEKVPLLSEVLDLIHKRVAVNIELKGSGTAQPVNTLLTTYITEKGWSARHFLITSLNHVELKIFTDCNKTIPVGALFDEDAVVYSVLDGIESAFTINLNAEKITRDNVKKIHSHGMKVFAYTVNSNSEAKRMARLKVDGIFTNYPDIATSLA